jgi:hypothetical protein
VVTYAHEPEAAAEAVACQEARESEEAAVDAHQEQHSVRETAEGARVESARPGGGLHEEAAEAEAVVVRREAERQWGAHP